MYSMIVQVKAGLVGRLWEPFRNSANDSGKTTDMVREVTFAWDLSDGRLDEPVEHRDSVLDDDLLVLAPRKRKRRSEAGGTRSRSAASPTDRSPASRRRSLDDRRSAPAPPTEGLNGSETRTERILSRGSETTSPTRLIMSKSYHNSQLRKQISMFLSASDWRALRDEAARQRVSLAELCRRSLAPALRAIKSSRDRGPAREERGSFWPSERPDRRA